MAAIRATSATPAAAQIPVGDAERQAPFEREREHDERHDVPDQHHDGGQQLREAFGEAQRDRRRHFRTDRDRRPTAMRRVRDYSSSTQVSE
jgi:hypothetical protein